METNRALNVTTVRLNGKRTRVTADWETSTDSGYGAVMPLSGDTGYFSFFSSSKVELVIKVLKGRLLDRDDWVLAGGLTNVNVAPTFTGTKTGQAKTYPNPQSSPFQPIQDTSAFADCT